MYSSLDISLCVLMFVMCFINTLGNAFIVIVNAVHWKKVQRLSTCDILLTSLGLANLFNSWVRKFTDILHFFGLRYTVMLELSLLSIITFSDLFTFWCTAWLYVFYYLKIANSQHPLFLRLKSRLPSKLSWILLCSVLVSMGTGLPLPWILYRSCHPTDVPTNSTSPFCYKSVAMSVFILSYSLPFLIFPSSAALLTASLCNHTRRMGHATTGFSQANLDVHFRAVKTVLAFLIVYLSYFIVMFWWNWYGTDSTFINIMFYLILLSFPCIHSVLLIQSNNKLRKTAIGILHRAKCQRREDSPEGPAQVMHVTDPAPLQPT